MKRKIAILIFLCAFIIYILFSAKNTNINDNYPNNVALQEEEETTEYTTEATTEPENDLTVANYTKGNFDDFFDLEYSDYISDSTFERIKKIYDTIDFSGEFKKGDEKLYDLYKYKFSKLLLNRCPFYDPYENKEKYLKDCDFESEEDYSLLYFLDIDGDNEPELYVYKRGLYIFKYLKDSDSFILWNEQFGPYESIYGTRKTMTIGQNMCIRDNYLLHDENGKIIESIGTIILPFNADNFLYLVSLPYHETDQRKEIDIELQKDGYINNYSKVIFFRVTEEQFNELMKDVYDREHTLHDEEDELQVSYKDFVNGYKKEHINNAIIGKNIVFYFLP